MWTASGSIWRRSWRAIRRASRCRTRRSCGTSNPIRRSRAPSSLPKPGMPPAFTRSAASSETVGRSGTAGSATTSGLSSAASRARSARVADRLVGSPEIYGHEEREAEQSVNFVTCHDGFTLNDLVSYDAQAQRGQRRGQPRRRRRQPQLELRRRRADRRSSLEKLRNRQVKNFLTVTLLSLGMPMILMGDEVRRTQRGNNNAYCQDNEISWFDWTLVEKHADVHRFVTLLNARRRLRDVEHERQRVSLNELIRQASKTWHGVKARAAGLGRSFPQPCFRGATSAGRAPALPDPERLLGAAGIRAAAGGRRGTGSWRRWIDTSLEPPQDINPWEAAPPLSGRTYRAAARSVVVLFEGSGELNAGPRPSHSLR